MKHLNVPLLLLGIFIPLLQAMEPEAKQKDKDVTSHDSRSESSSSDSSKDWKEEEPAQQLMLENMQWVQDLVPDSIIRIRKLKIDHCKRYIGILANGEALICDYHRKGWYPSRMYRFVNKEGKKTFLPLRTFWLTYFSLKTEYLKRKRNARPTNKLMRSHDRYSYDEIISRDKEGVNSHRCYFKHRDGKCRVEEYREINGYATNPQITALGEKAAIVFEQVKKRFREEQREERRQKTIATIEKSLGKAQK